MVNPYEGSLVSPLSVPVSKKKNFVLNLNQYRNTHFHVLNKSKVVYKQMMTSQVQQLPKLHKVHLTLTLYPRTKLRTDLDNVCSIHQKYLGDCLVELGILKDDSYDYIEDVTFKFGYVDKNNPRVEVHIKETTMKIVLTLEEAIQIIRTTNTVFENADITIEGTSTVEKEVEVQSQAEEPKKKRTRRTKAQIEADNAAVQEPTNASDESTSIGSDIDTSEVASTESLFNPDEEIFEETNEDEEPVYADTEMSLIDEVLAEEPIDEIAQTQDDDIIDLTKPLFG